MSKSHFPDMGELGVRRMRRLARYVSGHSPQVESTELKSFAVFSKDAMRFNLTDEV